MKKTRIINGMGAAAAAMLLTFAVSCEKEQTPIEQVEPVPALTLVGNESMKVVIDPGVTGTVTLDIETRFDPATELTIQEKNGETWCKAEFKGKDKIVLTADEATIDEDKTATFVIGARPESKAAEVVTVYQPSEVEFTVTRAKRPVEMKPAVEFTNLEGNAVKVPAGSTDKITLEFTTIFNTDNLAIIEKDGKDWCTATFQGNDKIVITPTDKSLDQDLTATFAVGVLETKANILYLPETVEFTVSREKKVEDPYIRLSGEGIVAGSWNTSCRLGAGATTLWVKVETNQPAFYISDESEGDWYFISTDSGKNGDEIMISVMPNSTTGTRSANILFTYEKDSWDGETLMITQTGQTPKPATTVTVKMDGKEISNNTEVSVAKLGGKANAVKFSYEADGQVGIKMVQPGTMKDFDDPYSIGSYGIITDEDPFGNTHHFIMFNNTTGQERKVDWVFVSEGKELFRIKLTQAGE